MTAGNGGPRPSTRIRLGAARSLSRAAGGARDLAGRSDQAGGVAGRASPVARHAARSFDSAAVYLRENEGRVIVRDLEKAIRRRPMLALAAAFFAGYLARRILR